MTGYIPPQSIPGNNIQKKKNKVTKRFRKRGDAPPIFPGTGPAGGGILDPNPTLAREDAWQGSTAFMNAAQNATQNPLQMLQDQLFAAVNNIQPQMTPIETLRKMAESQVRAQYDPQINALMSEMGAKGKRGRESQKTARQMYNGLSKDYLAQLPELTQQFAAEDNATNKRYDDAQAQMSAEYNKNAGAQDALLKQLGIQAAAPEAKQNLAADQAYFNNQMEADQQSSISALNEQQMAQQNYTQNLGNSARMAGENIAQDIGSQLEDYLTAANGQLRGLQGQRGSAIEALLAQMQQQDQQQQQQAAQQEFQNMMQLFNFQLATQKEMNNQAGAISGSPGAFGSGEGSGGLTTGLQGATNYLASQYPNQPVRATGLMENLNAVLGNQDVVNGKFVLEPGNEAMGKAPKYSDVGQEYMMNLLRQEFEKDGTQYGKGDINATMNALLAYLGKLR